MSKQVIKYARFCMRCNHISDYYPRQVDAFADRVMKCPNHPRETLQPAKIRFVENQLESISPI